MSQDITTDIFHEDRYRGTGGYPIESNSERFMIPQLGTAYATSSIANLQYKPNIDPGILNISKKRKIQIYDERIVEFKSVSRDLLDNAFERISNSTDSGIGQAERSNSFDEWKDLLHVISRKSEHFDNNHRKVLGALISATKRKDISDFNEDIVNFFVLATNILRQPRVTKPESRQVISRLLERKINTVIPLSLDSTDEKLTKELEDMMERLIAEEIRMNG